MTKSTVTIKTIPVSGNSSIDQQVEITPTGASVEDVMKAAGLKLDSKMQILVDDEPGDHRTHVPAGGTISFTEKVRGS